MLSLFAFSPMRYTEVVPRWLPAWWGPQLWTFVSYAFLHANFSHLFFNLVWLLAFGPPIARRFGALRFLIFCAATAAAGAAAHLVTHLGELAPMIGASAAVSGAMAAAMRFVFQQRRPAWFAGPRRRRLLPGAGGATVRYAARPAHPGVPRGVVRRQFHLRNGRGRNARHGRDRGLASPHRRLPGGTSGFLLVRPSASIRARSENSSPITAMMIQSADGDRRQPISALSPRHLH